MQRTVDLRAWISVVDEIPMVPYSSCRPFSLRRSCCRVFNSYASAPAAFSGTNCWGTDLGITVGGTTYNGAYANSVATWLHALAMTVATRKEYCPRVTIPWEKPYKAEIVPNVSPVDIIRV